jgi:hypothetical protein
VSVVDQHAVESIEGRSQPFGARGTHKWTCEP